MIQPHNACISKKKYAVFKNLNGVISSVYVICILKTEDNNEVDFCRDGWKWFEREICSFDFGIL